MTLKYIYIISTIIICNTWSVINAQTTEEDVSINPYLQTGYNENVDYFEDIDKPEILIKIEGAGVFTNGDYAPFWITNNSYGIGSESKNKEYIRAGIFSNKSFFDKKLDVSLGGDILVSHNMRNGFYIHQLYADLKYRSIGLSIGAKERINPFRNTYLTSGCLTLSNNARPIPQIEAGFPYFVTIPLTNEWLQIQGGLSYGWFLDDKYKENKVEKTGSYATDVLYHRKYAYFKVEKNTPWSFILGLEMDTQWGGNMYDNGELKTTSPGNLKNFFKILIPMSGGSDSNTTDQVNILGNVFGSWHFIFNYKFDDFSLKAYHEHFFEDHSGMFFKNIPDGLYGIEVNLNKKALISSFLVEYIHTKNQTGPFLWDTNPNIPIQVSAGDNYYNHGDYISLSNYGMVIGNPLLVSPIYNKNASLLVYNNRIMAFHAGMSGYLSDNLQYRLLLTHSRSWGMHGIPSTSIRSQFSTMAEAKYTHPKLSGWEFSGALAYDDAKTMVGNNLGFRVKIAKTFHVK